MKPFFHSAQDPISCGTHAIGAVAAVFGGFLFLLKIARGDTTLLGAASALCFCLSMIALYSASAVYHYYPGNTASCGVKKMLRKLDHSMIYVLIVGSYTPFCLTMLPAHEGKVFCCVLWAIAVAGIVAKMLWINAPRVLTTAVYLALGWSILFVLKDFDITHPLCLLLIALGGISYSIGAIFYALKWPNYSKDFGFHELFHLFILGGSLFHFFAVFFYVL